MVPPMFLKQTNYSIILSKVKRRSFPGFCLAPVLDGALHALSWQGASTFWSRMAVSGPSSEFSIVSGLFHPFNSPKG